MSDIIQLENEALQLRSEGKYEEAAAKLHELLELEPTFVRAHSALAVVYFKMGDAEKSCHHGEKTIELEPNVAFNYTALSVTYQRAWTLTQDQKYIQLAEDTKAKGDTL